MKWKIVLAILLVVILVGGGWLIWLIRHIVKDTTPNAYAVEWVADMVITHMEANNGRWPANWDDLRDDYEHDVQAVRARPWTFDELRSRVEVDWQADPESLARTADPGKDPPFRVIWLKDGSTTHWTGMEPNRTILNYLKKRAASSRPTSSPRAPSSYTPSSCTAG